MARSCTTCQHTAAGLDGLDPAEIALLSMKLYALMSILLNLIEKGQPWPEGFQRARAAFVEEEEGVSDIPLQIRILLMLPCLYRR